LASLSKTPWGKGGGGRSLLYRPKGNGSRPLKRTTGEREDPRLLWGGGKAITIRPPGGGEAIVVKSGQGEKKNLRLKRKKPPGRGGKGRGLSGSKTEEKPISIT